MAPLLAPYNSSMRLGSGFNSYTQQLCVDDAVRKGNAVPPEPTKPEDGVAQSVIYKTSIIDKMSDITDALNISGALTIKYNNLIDGTGKGTFINSNKINDADINFLISVKVINQTITDNALTEFTPVENLDPSIDFTQVYGDSFISGFQEGGDFNAVISVKVKDKNQKESIKADASVALTTPSFGASKKDKKKTEQFDKTQTEDNETKEPGTGEEDSLKEPESTQDPNSPGGLTIKGNAEVEKIQQDIFKENEITISVNWSGGGQELKASDEDWDVTNLRKAALRFPALVAKTPVRTHAVLTKYTSLKSFYTKSNEGKGNKAPLSYDNAGVYTSILQDAFLDYKNIYKDIRFLEADVDSKTKKLEKSTFNETPEHSETPFAKEPFPATLTGLESAKFYIRRMMNLIVKDVDLITKEPGLASDDRQLPCQCPLIFKHYLPIGVPINEAHSN
ncbi:hypothetical protein SI65_09169 [Aspergillus cristatus]|uniref:Uncharacterized protein n=1 Tax=Aspergillus cristatus TaxID=573508 RepID=A0A1E3B565_ASPCR|nr:hypothetical protein SI65_09169 [Aspergillus cristatus]